MYDMYFIDGYEGKYLTFVNPRNDIIVKCWKPDGEQSWPYIQGNITTFEGNTYIGRVETIEEGKDMYPEYFI